MKIKLLKEYEYSKNLHMVRRCEKGEILSIPEDIAPEAAASIVHQKIAEVVKTEKIKPPMPKKEEPKADKGKKEDKSLKAAPEDKGK